MTRTSKLSFRDRIFKQIDARMPWLGFVFYVFSRGQKDQFLRVAASLSYTSLIALVPLVAISVAIFSAFPAFSEVRAEFQTFISESLVPNAGQSVDVYLKQFIGATSQLTTVGVVGLGVTALLTLTTIEAALNAIFRVTKQRPMVSRVLVYWAVLTLGPLLLGVSSSMSGGLFALGRSIGGGAFEEVSGFVTVFMPLIFSWLAFSLLYLAVPNRPVAFRDALIGGVVAAVLFALLRMGFARFVASANTYRTLYGALAVIPLFLMSMYLSWAVVLFGAVMTAAFPEWRVHKTFGENVGSAVSEVVLSLSILGALRGAQTSGEKVSRRLLITQVLAPDEVMDIVLGKLQASGFADHTEDGNWMLVRDLSETPMSTLLEGLGHGWAAASTTPLTSEWKDVLSGAVKVCVDAERGAWDMPIRVALDQVHSASAVA